MQELELNEEQKNVVYDESKVCLVNANVGSGKTRVLIAKVLHLVLEKKIPLEKMIILTFTNKAADEIKNRLFATEYSKNHLDMEVPFLGTFHSVSANLLKKVLPIQNLGYQPDFSIITPEEELYVANQVILERGFQIKYKNRLKKRLKQAGKITDPDKKISKYGDDIFLLVDALKEELKKQNKITYDQLIEFTSLLLHNNPKLIEPEYLIIDEVQDCDQMQLDLINELVKNGTKLFAVGDPNQVIYSWRGSAFQIFSLLRDRYEAKEYTLSINYRSSMSILQASKRMMQISSELKGIKEEGSQVEISSYYNAFMAADDLASKIKQFHEAGISYDEIAVFYRKQEQAQTYFEVFQREGIPVSILARKSLSEIPVLNWFYQMLAYDCNQDNTSAGVYILTDKEYGAKMSPKKALGEIKKGYQVSVNPLCLLGEESYTEDMLYQYWQLDTVLKSNSASYTSDYKLIMYFLKKLADFCNGKGTVNPDKLYIYIQEFLNDMILKENNLLGELYQKNGSQGCVSLMTLHASKGLEFSHVFIVGVNNGLIPMKITTFEEEDEERRLLFVGMTRAKNYLELSYYTSSDQYGVFEGPSRFLGILDRDKKLNDRRTAQDKANHLQDIKRQILQARIDQNPVEEQKVEETEKQQRVKHEKYGTGTLVEENDNCYVIEFDDYGKKELMKMFTQLERI